MLHSQPAKSCQTVSTSWQQTWTWPEWIHLNNIWEILTSEEFHRHLTLKKKKVVDFLEIGYFWGIPWENTRFSRNYGQVLNNCQGLIWPRQIDGSESYCRSPRKRSQKLSHTGLKLHSVPWIQCLAKSLTFLGIHPDVLLYPPTKLIADSAVNVMPGYTFKTL